ncbi:MAG: hypothetical protein AAGA30_18450, partial [Planctomycetota bacterium]
MCQIFFYPPISGQREPPILAFLPGAMTRVVEPPYIELILVFGMLDSSWAIVGLDISFPWIFM